jgi:hypothetical protein
MKKYLIILLSIVTLVIGLVVGWFVSAHFYIRQIESYMKTSAYNSLSERGRVLIDLRAGKTNEAAETLETLMDGDILVFGSFLRDSPADSSRPEEIRLLTTVRDYRAAHPWKSPAYPDIDKGVADVFALVITNQSRR